MRNSKMKLMTLAITLAMAAPALAAGGGQPGGGGIIRFLMRFLTGY